MTRKTNSELDALPGFFFYPSDTEGLEELTYSQRCELLTNQGNYMVPVWQNDPMMKGDVECMLSNSRIPTHRNVGVVIPGNGDVPFDLRTVIQL